jgi:hypothetical protein
MSILINPIKPWVGMSHFVKAQLQDEGILLFKQKLLEKDPKHDCFRKDEKDIIWFGQRLVVPDNWELKMEIFDKGHLYKFSIHPGSSKMYQDLKENFGGPI